MLAIFLTLPNTRMTRSILHVSPPTTIPHVPISYRQSRKFALLQCSVWKMNMGPPLRAAITIPTRPMRTTLLEQLLRLAQRQLLRFAAIVATNSQHLHRASAPPVARASEIRNESSMRIKACKKDAETVCCI